MGTEKSPPISSTSSPRPITNQSQSNSTSQSHHLIREGQTVILDINGDKQSFAVAKASTKVRIGKTMCSLGPLVGAPFGSVFEIHSGPSGRPTLQRVRQEDLRRSDCGGGWQSTAEGAGAEIGENGQQEGSCVRDVSMKDNRSLVDNNTAQGLSSQDIDRMKQEGVSGRDIVDALVASSKSFQSKTEFSQEKYRRKKQKKYAPRVVLCRPSARSVCEAYFSKSPYKIGFLRMDTLGMLLSLGNVGAYAEVLVIETCGGLVTGAAAERLGGYGKVCSAYRGERPSSIDIIRLFNLEDTAPKCVTRTSIGSLLDALETVEASPANGGTTISEKAAADEERRDGGSNPVGKLQCDKVEGADVASGVCPEKKAEERCVVPSQAPGSAEVQQHIGRMTTQLEMGADTSVPPRESEGRAEEVESMLVDDSLTVLESKSPEVAQTSSEGHGEQQFAPPPVETEVDEKVNNLQKLTEAEDKMQGSAGEHKASAAKGEECGDGEAKAGKEAQGKDSVSNKVETEAGGRRRGGGSGGKLWRYATKDEIDCWARYGFDSLIVAAPDIQPLAIATQVLPLIKLSGFFAIFSPSLQSLADCMQWLQSNKEAVSLQLSEPWLREYQVMPARTHPHMQMSATGGFILSGIRVSNKPWGGDKPEERTGRVDRVSDGGLENNQEGSSRSNTIKNASKRGRATSS
ncbi:hypothetical protein CBR_g45432 [Chara braunii]|uniref:tRNA (adenine(58)-N(1))-methyltransferase non-catalytic subunit TRM6 n=1 Tax=Chara braunii TaxID=69332 RepID=A0A388LYN7_CHABU|nr:hypothetical protein CBR_g45432 [Chara braunii]|eukprot:GBG87373.1 hypothetical protein CBR_g45432 [Chara braunii]